MVTKVNVIKVLPDNPENRKAAKNLPPGTYIKTRSGRWRSATRHERALIMTLDTHNNGFWMIVYK
jgi:hypothetical protein